MRFQMIIFIVLFLVFLTEGEAGKSKSKLCQYSVDEPTEETMNLVLYSYNTSWIDPHKRSPSELTTYQRNESECPKGLNDINPPAVKRLCPHHVVVNYDPNRIPRVIFEARCKCTACLSETGFTENMCKPVYYFRHVLLKKPKEKCYSRQVVAFSVGCQCIGHIIPSTNHAVP